MAMPISINIPERIESDLRAKWGDLDQAAKEALAIKSYRTARISLGQVAELLGMGVIEAQGWLSQHGIPLNYSLDDLEADRRALAGLAAEEQR
jgi:predicted HTH domain antitoxin